MAIPMKGLILATVVLLAGCVPSDPGPDFPVAVRRAGDPVEVLYVACAPADVVSVAVLRSEDSVFRYTDPPVWKIRFASPARLARAVVGEVPPGATEEVRLAAPLDRKTHYEAVIELATGAQPRQGFQLDRLGDRVAFHGEYLSEKDFDRERACPAPS